MSEFIGECAVCMALADKAERGEINPGIRCTLHGGYMTATEVDAYRAMPHQAASPSA